MGFISLCKALEFRVQARVAPRVRDFGTWVQALGFRAQGSSLRKVSASP